MALWIPVAAASVLAIVILVSTGMAVTTRYLAALIGQLISAEDHGGPEREGRARG